MSDYTVEFVPSNAFHGIPKYHNDLICGHILQSLIDPKAIVDMPDTRLDVPLYGAFHITYKGTVRFVKVEFTITLRPDQSVNKPLLAVVVFHVLSRYWKSQEDYKSIQHYQGPAELCDWLRDRVKADYPLNFAFNIPESVIKYISSTPEGEASVDVCLSRTINLTITVEWNSREIFLIVEGDRTYDITFDLTGINTRRTLFNVSNAIWHCCENYV